MEQPAPSSWARRPLIATVLKTVVFVVPIVISMVFIMIATRIVPRPEGLATTAAWFVVLTLLATVVVVRSGNVLRRLLPIAALFNISLVFPDHAPSRFKVAMRKNTVRQLQRKVAAGTVDSQTPQEAAEHLLMLAGALNDHDRLTRGHTERVRAYSLMIGEELGLDEDELAKLHWAGLIHDVGKLEVPAEILTKDGRPSDEEWQILRSHPEMGGALVAPLRPWLGQWADAASQHHEWYDGTGYPFGLAGDEISISGRIVAVADAYDVITSARSYKPPHSAEYGRKELADGAGTQFDPDVVRAFLNIGLGKLRVVMGPLSWLGELSAVAQNTAVPAVTSAASVALTATLGLIPGAAAVTPEVAAPVAREVAATTTTAGPTSVPSTTSSSTTSTTTTTPVLEAASVTLEAVAGAPATVDVAALYPDEGIVLTVLEAPAEGLFSLDEDGVALFLAPPDFSGELTAEVLVCRPDGECVESTIVIVVAPWTGEPVPLDDVATGDEDTALTIDVVANDTSLDGSPLTVTAVERIGGWAGDSASVVANRLVYIPAADASGSVTLVYTVANDGGLTAEATASIEIAAVNDAPAFMNSGDILVDEDSGAFSLQWATSLKAGPANEAAQSLSFELAVDDTSLFSVNPALSTTGRVTFTPAAETVGSTIVRATLVDTGGTANGGTDRSAVATFRIKIGDVNDPPDPGDDLVVTAEDTTVVFDVLVNDTDIDGDTVVFSTYDGSGISLGILTSLGDGDFSFSPATNVSGSDSFTYTVKDGNGGSNSATVTLTVSPVNDAPTASPEGYNGLRNTVLTVAAPGLLANDADIDSILLSVETTAVSGPSDGSLTLAADGSFTYTPDPGFYGSDSFVYRLVDDGGLTDTATVTLQIDQGISSLQLYFDNTGGSPTDWDLVAAPPPPGDPEPDVDGDGDEGLTFKKTDKGLAETEKEKLQQWSIPAGSGGLHLEGPVTLQLWSALTEFHDEEEGHVFVWLRDCLGTSCTEIAATDLFQEDWATTEDWVYDEISFGTVDHTIAAGRELRIMVQFDEHDAWVAMSAGRPSGLLLTLASS